MSRRPTSSCASLISSLRLPGARSPRARSPYASLTEEQMPARVPPGLPSDLLVRRPDIRSTEQGLIAAGARIDVARKAYLPRISLTGFLGFESASLSDLFKPSRSVWGFVPQVTQPIFTAGRLRSNVR